MSEGVFNTAGCSQLLNNQTLTNLWWNVPPFKKYRWIKKPI